MVSGERLPDCRPPEQALRRDIRAMRQIGPQLKLQECIRGKELVECGKGFERCRPVTESIFAIPNGSEYSALQTQNGSLAQIREHHSLHRERNVPQAAVPGVVLVLCVDRHVNFDLIVDAKSLFMDNIGGKTRCP